MSKRLHLKDVWGFYWTQKNCKFPGAAEKQRALVGSYEAANDWGEGEGEGGGSMWYHQWCALWFTVDLKSPAMCGSQFIEDLQQCGQGPGLGFTAKGTILAVLIGQLGETLPWRAEEPTKKKGGLFAHESTSRHNNHVSITFNNCCAALKIK